MEEFSWKVWRGFFIVSLLGAIIFATSLFTLAYAFFNTSAIQIRVDIIGRLQLDIAMCIFGTGSTIISLSNAFMLFHSWFKWHEQKNLSVVKK